MGFVNTISSINKINSLLKDLENQVSITQDQVQRNASVETLQNSLNVLKNIHQEMIDTFGNSRGARMAMYTVFGDKMQMPELLLYSKNVIYHLYAIIQSK